MALRWASSFDNVQDTDASGLFSSVTQTPGSGGTALIQFSATYSRWPSAPIGKGLRLQASASGGPSTSFNTTARLIFDAQGTWIVGAAHRGITLGTNSAQLVFALKSGSSYVFELRWNGSAYVSTRNGTVVATGAAVGNTQHSFVELKVVIGTGTAGSYEVRVNGVSYLSGSSTNTSGTGGTTADTLEMGGTYSGTTGGNSDAYWDDLYVADGTGSGTTIRDFVGDCRPYEMLPDANGTFSDWTQTGGTASTPYTAVNDSPHNSDTSYLFSGTLNQRTTLNYPDVPVGTVKAVILAPWFRKDDVNTRAVSARTYRSTTESTSAQSIAPGASYSMRQIIMETDPQTGSTWTVSNVNATEFGLVVTT